MRWTVENEVDNWTVWTVSTTSQRLIPNVYDVSVKNK